MLTFSLATAFILTVALGATAYWRGRQLARPARWLTVCHGLMAALAVGLLVFRVLSGAQNLWFNASLFLFVLTIIGGLFAWLVRERHEPPILPLVLLHVCTGFVALILLFTGIATSL